VNKNNNHGILYSFDDWKFVISDLTKTLDVNYEQYGFKTPIIPIFHPVFRECKIFMGSPVCMFDHKTIIGKSIKFNKFNELKEYLDNNVIIPYMLYSFEDYYIFRGYKDEGN